MCENILFDVPCFSSVLITQTIDNFIDSLLFPI
jgi:hypothetical protein